MNTLETLSIYSILLPLIIGLIFLKKMSKDSILIWGIVLIGTIPQLLNPYFNKTSFLNVLYNLYIIAEFILLSIFLSKKIFTFILRRVFKIIFFAYTILATIIFFINGFYDHFLNELIIINSLIYTTWILMILLEQYGEKTLLNITLVSPVFWYLSGYFLYAVCTTMPLSLWEIMQDTPDSISNITLRIIFSIFNINLYVFISIGFIIEVINKKGSY